MAVIKTEKLTKYYTRGKILGVKDLDLEVYEGETFGFIGPNGAGKTTTMRLLLDFIRPTSGKAKIFDIDVNENPIEIQKQIGFLPGEVYLPEHLTGKETVEYFKKFKNHFDEKYLKDLISKLDLDLKRKVQNYSKGNKQKLAVVLALMHRPKLLLLDEPTSGLDPLNQEIFYEIINKLEDEGFTIFLSTHILSEAQKVCDRVGLIKKGKLVRVENIEELKNKNIRNIVIDTTRKIPEKILSMECIEKHEKIDKGYKITSVGKIGSFIRQLSSIDIQDIHVSEPTLEETFINYYRE
ncbi:ABC transporter ATP-binding protein [Patescibacteria group bacterium]